MGKKYHQRGGKTTHGMTKAPIYRRWASMMSRCYTESFTNYARWGGRGITVCKRWHKFENFCEDMGSTFKKELQLDRIDNDGNYNKKNCRWVTCKENMNNRANTITYDGELAEEASKRLGGAAGLIRVRMHRGWELERAFTTKAVTGQK